MKNRKKMPPKAIPGVPVAKTATPPNKRNIMRRTSATMTPDRFCWPLNLSQIDPQFYNNIVGVFITRQDLPESNLLRDEAGQDRPSTTMNILFLDRHIGCSLRLWNRVQRIPRRTVLLGLGLLLQALPSTSNSTLQSIDRSFELSDAKRNSRCQNRLLLLPPRIRTRPLSDSSLGRLS